MGDEEKSCGSSFWESSEMDANSYKKAKAEYKKKKLLEQSQSQNGNSNDNPKKSVANVLKKKSVKK